MSRRWLVTNDSMQHKVLIYGEETSVGAAYQAADKRGMSYDKLFVTELTGETVTYDRGWVKEFVPNNS